MVIILEPHNQKLIAELDAIVQRLEMPRGHVRALREADLNSTSGITNAIGAAARLTEAMKARLRNPWFLLNCLN